MSTLQILNKHLVLTKREIERALDFCLKSLSRRRRSYLSSQWCVTLNGAKIKGKQIPKEEPENVLLNVLKEKAEDFGIPFLFVQVLILCLDLQRKPFTMSASFYGRHLKGLQIQTDATLITICD